MYTYIMMDLVKLSVTYLPGRWSANTSSLVRPRSETIDILNQLETIVTAMEAG